MVEKKEGGRGRSTMKEGRVKSTVKGGVALSLRGVRKWEGG